MLIPMLLCCSWMSVASPQCAASPQDAQRILMTKNPFSASTPTQHPPATAQNHHPSQKMAQIVNINQADAATLARLLTGVGAKKAQAIIEYRQTHGDFQRIDDLVLVKGIGAATLEKNRDRIRLN
ncbi:MAG: ComEA family DNA-binding protein [Pseudomonadota bacterium]|nr:ComEA family DNA-binding protein [Pseudomonadota bacterium]